MCGFGYGYALVVQLLLLCSVYVIYFQSTLMSGLKPQQTLLKQPPANRLVVFLTHGLSAKSFFEYRCRNLPDLRKIFLKQGQVGISHSPAVTTFRSAQVSIFSGCYEDALAPVHGVAFDTIFNRSTRSYAWAPGELLQYFPAIYKMKTLPNEISNWAEDSSKLDEWSFKAVVDFLDSEAPQLQHLRGLVFIIQLLGLQVSNGIKMFHENLNYTQRGIWTTYKRFLQAFPDRRTAFLLISHHGKPVWASKSKQELETPFLLWGAGVSNSNSRLGRTFVANEQQQRLPLHVLEPVQLTPLMSGLLGLPPPVNNRGQQPAGLLNASSHEAHAMYTNMLQLLEQALQARRHHRRGFLNNLMPNYWMNCGQLDKLIATGNLLWYQRRFLLLKEYSEDVMPLLLQCIMYYEHYYRRILLLASAFAYLGWLHQLRCLSGQAGRTSSRQLLLAKSLLRLLILLIFAFVLLQRVSWLNSGLLLLPGLIWTMALKTHEKSANIMSCRQLMWPIVLSLCCIAVFFDRRYISCCYMGFTCYNNRCIFIQRRSLNFYIWLMIVCCLTLVCWLPCSLGYWQRSLLLGNLILTLVRPFVCRTLHLACATHRQSLLCNGLVLFMAGLHLLCSSQPWMIHLIARAYLCYVFYPRSRQQALELIIFNLCTLYAMLCTSFESLVIQLLAMELQLALRLRQENEMEINQKQTMAMYIFMYSMYSFFVIGEIAAVYRFCYYIRITGFGYYSMLINGLLIALKLLLPVLLLLCIICVNCEIAWPHRREIFQRLLIMCNFMALIFLFRVRADGSWWEIRDRLIHLIVVQVLPFICLLLINLAHFMLGDSAKDLLELPKWNERLVNK
ncbi:GPI ethanolamine phosphate transferase 1 [Drosophila grimshawi]|uniref:GPI ethanolamine phosphate transferase 1 n=1 Tax=Drosophila grimshawi TaxID=7222 RepID=UPI001C933654|nr:GPI ethanolamine phosphate transferase 1 [Drosophila grimshawi]